MLGAGGFLLWLNYTSILWAAPYFAIAFAIVALVLLVVAIMDLRGNAGFAGRSRRQFAIALFAISIFGYPPATAGIMSNDTGLRVVFGLFPDPVEAAILAARQVLN